MVLLIASSACGGDGAGFDSSFTTTATETGSGEAGETASTSGSPSTSSTASDESESGTTAPSDTTDGSTTSTDGSTTTVDESTSGTAESSTDGDSSSSESTGGSACGNGLVDDGEACDATDLGGHDCTTLGLGFTGGTLACDPTCMHDDAGCTSFPLPGPGELVITEIMQNPSMLADTVGEWFELHNPSAVETYQLWGCTVSGKMGDMPFDVDADLAIGPGEFATLAVTSMNGPGFVPDFSYSGYTLDNTTDEIGLACDGMTVDVVAYDGGLTFPNPSGASMNLDPDAYDDIANDAGAEWCLATQSYNGDLGTPGAANDTCYGMPGPQSLLLFSEYVEGSGFNKAVELWNSSAVDPVDLTGCSVRIYSNGAAAPNSTINVTPGLLPPDGAWVVCNTQISDATNCDQLSGSLNHNGNDTIVLECNAVQLDVFGQIAFDPGVEWLANGVGTANETLRRDCLVTMGDPDGADVFDPSLQWATFAQDDLGDLGQHCP